MNRQTSVAQKDRRKKNERDNKWTNLPKKNGLRKNQKTQTAINNPRNRDIHIRGRQMEGEGVYDRFFIKEKNGFESEKRFERRFRTIWAQNEKSWAVLRRYIFLMTKMPHVINQDIHQSNISRRRNKHLHIIIFLGGITSQLDGRRIMIVTP